MNLDAFETWEAVAKAIQTKESYLYDTSDGSHCVDLAQIVCTALVQLGKGAA